MREIQLTKGYVAQVDDEDFDRVSKLKWSVSRTHRSVYAVHGKIVNGKNKIIYMHRFVMNAQKGQIIDHIDGCGLMNCKSNLRFCDNAQNARNKRPCAGTSSGFKGVARSSGCKSFYARIGVSGKIIHLGSFPTPEDAARAYDRAARKYFGEFARTNFPDNQI